MTTRVRLPAGAERSTDMAWKARRNWSPRNLQNSASPRLPALEPLGTTATIPRSTRFSMPYRGAVLEQLVIRDAGLDDAERLGAAHVIAAEEAYGHYFPAEFMQRNTVER